MKRKPKPAGRLSSSGGGSPKRTSNGVRLRRVPGENAWEFVHPRCALDRSEDLAEVQQMLAAGEVEIAMDELRWLLGGCSEYIEAHQLLGELALGENDMALARGHFGYAFRIGEAALKWRDDRAPIPYARKANAPFYSAGKGLAWCLLQQENRDMAREVIDTLIDCDPSDPLGVRGLLT